MRFAKDFRRIAMRALDQNYWMAVLVTFVGLLLGASVSTLGGTSYVTVSLDENHISRIAAQPMGNVLMTLLIVGVSLATIYTIAIFLIGSVMDLGLARYNLGIVDGKREPFAKLFSAFDLFGKAVGLRCWKILFTTLWTLLFIVPGVIAAYRYSMSTYIMAEHPEIGIREAVRMSKKMMHGNKRRLFCLDLSFIGWWLLCILTFGIGFFFLMPYINAAHTAFYLEVSGQSYRLEQYGDKPVVQPQA